MADNTNTIFGYDKLSNEDLGYVESVSYSVTSDVSDVKDKDGKVKAKAFYGYKKEANLTVISKGQSKKIGDTISIANKQYYITSIEEQGSSSDFIKLNIKATLYGKDSSIVPDVDLGS